MELSQNNVMYVIINMRAPNDDTLTTLASNMFTVNGQIMNDLEEIYSNEVNVEIHKEDVRTEISGVKTWEDENDKLGKRPESVKLQVKAYDEVISEAEVNEYNAWSYEFEVPKYDELGNEISYVIDEKETVGD